MLSFYMRFMALASADQQMNLLPRCWKTLAGECAQALPSSKPLWKLILKMPPSPSPPPPKKTAISWASFCCLGCHHLSSLIWFNQSFQQPHKNYITEHWNLVFAMCLTWVHQFLEDIPPRGNKTNSGTDKEKQAVWKAAWNFTLTFRFQSNVILRLINS